MESNEKGRVKYVRIAAITSLIGNAVLALLKITVGLVAKSNALIGDGMDSSADVLISVISLAIVGILAKPPDANHPWGHGKAETIATALLSFILFFMGAQLIVSSASNFFSGEQRDVPSMAALIVTLISIAGKILLAWSQHVLGKRANSAMIKANAKNMASDVLISIGVLAGLILSTLTGSAHADTLFALLIGAWVIKTAVGIFLEAHLELMDGSSDTKSYRAIVDAVRAVEGADNPHRARMRCIAGFWDIDLDIDVDPQCTVLEAHAIASQVERAIKQRLENVFDIVIHVEPRGEDSTEVFGLSEKDMSE